MSVKAMNHFTIVSDDLEATRKFYSMFGLEPGERPNLPVPGMWLYAEGTPILHVILRKELPVPQGMLDHMAFTAKDLPAVHKKLKDAGYEIDLRRIPGRGQWQLFTRDPKGVRVEFDFGEDEAAPAGYEPA